MQKDFKGSMANEISEDFLEGVSGGKHGGYLYKNYATGKYGYAADTKFHSGFNTREEAIEHALSHSSNTIFVKDTTAGTQLGYTEIGKFER